MKRGAITLFALLVVAGVVYLLFTNRPSDVGGIGPGEETAEREAGLLEGDAPKGVVLHVLGKEPPAPPAPLPEPIPMAERTGTLTIDVLGPGGSPVESAAIWVVAKGRRRRNTFRTVWLPTRTRIAVPPEELSVWVRRADSAVPKPVDVDARSGSAHLVVELKRPTVLRGTVTGPSGIRLHNAKVLLLLLEGRDIPKWRRVSEQPSAKQAAIGRTAPTYSINLVPGRYLVGFSYGAVVHARGIVDMDDEQVEHDIVAPPLPEDFATVTINGVTDAERNRLVISLRVTRGEASLVAAPVLVPTWEGDFHFRLADPQPEDRDHIVIVSHPKRGAVEVPFVPGHRRVIDLQRLPELSRVEVDFAFAKLDRLPADSSMHATGWNQGMAGEPIGTHEWTGSGGRLRLYKGPVIVALHVHVPNGRFHTTIEVARFEVDATKPGRKILTVPTLYRVKVYSDDRKAYATLLHDVGPTARVWRHNTQGWRNVPPDRPIVFRAVAAGDYKLQSGGRTVRLRVPDQLTVRLPSR